MGGLTEENRDWFLNTAQRAEAHLAGMSWHELGPAGRILRHGADYKVQDARIIDVREQDGSLHLDVAVRIAPHVPENIVINVTQIDPPR